VVHDLRSFTSTGGSMSDLLVFVGRDKVNSQGKHEVGRQSGCGTFSGQRIELYRDSIEFSKAA
jgi:hypothetical protein